MEKQRWEDGGKSQRGEEKKREDQRREIVRRTKMQVREKVGKSEFTVFFQWFVAPEVHYNTTLHYTNTLHYNTLHYTALRSVEK